LLEAVGLADTAAVAVAECLVLALQVSIKAVAVPEEMAAEVAVVQAATVLLLALAVMVLRPFASIFEA
jgi:hypothetical protein